MESSLADIEKIISKPPRQRSDTDIRKLHPWFKQRADTFRSLKSDAISDIIRNCELIRRLEDNVIINQGDKGDCFFIILSGKVSVFIQSKEDEEDTEVEEEVHKFRSRSNTIHSLQSLSSRPDLSISPNGQTLSHHYNTESSNQDSPSVGLNEPGSPRTVETDIQTRTQQHASDLNLDITDQRVRTKSAVLETTNRTGGKHPAVSPSHASDLDDVFEEDGTPQTMSRRLRASVSGSELFPKMRPRKRSSTLETVVEAFHLPTISSLNQPLDRSRYGLCVGSLEDGKSFGELALLKKDCIRNASIITDTTSQLLVVNRQLYNRCIRESQEKEFRAKQKFVHSSEYFENWSVKSKRQFANCLTVKTYTYGTPIVCQGLPVNGIFFLKSGQCRVIIDPTMHPNQYPNHYPIIDEDESLEKLKMSCEEYVPPQIPRRRRNKGYVVRGYDICLIGNRNMIGDVELAANLSTFMQSVVCEQESVAFVIDTKNYERLVSRRHQETVKLITHNAMLKLDNRAMRFQQIPLLKVIIQRYRQQLLPKQKKRRVSDIIDRVSPVPPHGPLVDMFGPGTVFHYIRTRQRQIRKAKAASKQTSIIQKSVKSQTMTTVTGTSDDECYLQYEDTEAHVVPLTGLERLHAYEEQRMNRLEERILAWHINVEATKTNSPITDNSQ